MNMDSKYQLSLAVNISLIIFLISVNPVSAMALLNTDTNSTEETNNNGTIKLPRETCLAPNGQPFVKHFANADNCNSYWHCIEVSPGVPEAVEQPCPPYFNIVTGQNEPLCWNFMTCTCDYPWNTACYDSSQLSHINYRYHCAEALNRLPVEVPGIHD